MAIQGTKNFGGLTYDILKDNGNGIYEIQTADFGRMQIYAAPSTEQKLSKAKAPSNIQIQINYKYVLLNSREIALPSLNSQHIL